MGLAQGIGQGVDERPVAFGHAFFHQGREAAQKIDPHGLYRPIQGPGYRDHLIPVERGRRHGHGTDGDAFVDHRDDVLFANGIANGDQPVGGPGDPVVNLGGETLEIITDTIQQVEPQGDGAQVQVLVAQHVQDGDDFVLR